MMVYVGLSTWSILNSFLTFMQYITWISNNHTSWTLKAAGLGADASVQISARSVAEEPMVCALKRIL